MRAPIAGDLIRPRRERGQELCRACRRPADASSMTPEGLSATFIAGPFAAAVCDCFPALRRRPDFAPFPVLQQGSPAARGEFPSTIGDSGNRGRVCRTVGGYGERFIPLRSLVRGQGRGRAARISHRGGGAQRRLGSSLLSRISKPLAAVATLVEESNRPRRRHQLAFFEESAHCIF